MPSAARPRDRYLLPFRRGLLLLAAGIFWTARLLGAGATEAPSRTVSPVEITSFEQIWQMTETEKKEWHHLRMEYVVYYYDPPWQAMWGRSGEADSYLSIGTKPFPIKPGQKILIDGLILPATGLVVDEPKVTLLAESVPMEAVATRGDIGNTERFNKRLVTVEGYVTRQTARDANHQELELAVEGRVVIVQLLLGKEEEAPQVKGDLVRVKGVYFARNESTWTTPKLEIWVQGVQSVEVLGQLDRDKNFQRPATPINLLSASPGDKLVRIAGIVQAQQPGKSLTLRDNTGSIIFDTVQPDPMDMGEEVEAIGFPLAKGRDEGGLRQALYRRTQPLITNFDQIWQLSESEKNKSHPARFDFVVYYHDPIWKTAWGRSGGVDGFLSLGELASPLKPGQEILLEGIISPSKGMAFDQPRVTLLSKSVPLDFQSSTGQIGNTELLNKHLVVVEGYADRQSLDDSRHLKIDLVTEGRAVTVRVLLEKETDVPQVEGALLKVKGVYSATSDPNNALPKLEVWVQGRENIEVKGWLARDERFDLPTTPIENIAAAIPEKLIHVAGTVRAQEPGKLLTIRDETGQLTLQTAQASLVQLGEQVEAIGFPVRRGTEWTLTASLYRRIRASGEAPALGLRNLRLAEQLRELSPEDAARGYPVQLSGVVLWANAAADFIFVRDASGGVRAIRPPNDDKTIVVGTKVVVKGASGAGKFTPVVLAADITGTATMELPEGRPVTLEQAFTGSEDSQWVAMSGYVRNVVQDGPWGRLELTTSAGEFSSMLPWSKDLAKFKRSVVRLRGVCSVLTNGKHQLTGIQLWIPSTQFVEVEEAEPANPFAVPLRSISSLRQFNSSQMANRRVRVTGVVIDQTPGRALYVQDGTEGLLVLSRESEPMTPGDRVEVVGFPGHESTRAVLREAVYRKISAGAEPEPLEVTTPEQINLEFDGRLVRLEAVLLDFGAQEKGTRLILQANGRIFEALLNLDKDAVPDSWAPGSRVALTGVYQVQFDDDKRPKAVEIQLRSLPDVQILQRPSWWNVRHALILTGILAISVILGLAWVVALQRRVRLQTGQIRTQIETEKAARLDVALVRASKLESLGLLAGGIAHDFNNLLTVILGNLSMLRFIERLQPEATDCVRESERAALRARDLTQQLLTFAKGGAPVREAILLPDVIREAAEFGLHGSKVRCDFSLPNGLWAADVDKGQIGQVVHNLVINAMQAMPDGGTIHLKLANEEVTTGAVSGLAAGRYVKLTVADNGTGIRAESLPRIFEPYFTTKTQGSGLGLATVYSIIKKHQGHIEVESTVGRGTTFTLWLPAANAVSTPAPTPPVLRQTKTGRFLVLDDEAPIRQMLGVLLKRLGFEVTTVADGAEAVREYRTALDSGRPYELVMLDLTIPGGMGGSAAMEQLRQMDPEICAIVSSGYSGDPVMANYRAHGFRAVVAKPYEIGVLVKTIQELLPHHVLKGGLIPPSDSAR